MLAQLTDVLPEWAFLAIHCCGFVPALGAFWLRRKEDRLTGAWKIFLVVYYATLALLFGIVLVNAKWPLSLSVSHKALFGGGSYLLAIVGVPIGLAMVGHLGTPTLRDATQRCERCRYDLTKNESGRCPECGVVRERSEIGIGEQRDAC